MSRVTRSKAAAEAKAEAEAKARGEAEAKAKRDANPLLTHPENYAVVSMHEGDRYIFAGVEIVEKRRLIQLEYRYGRKGDLPNWERTSASSTEGGGDDFLPGFDVDMGPYPYDFELRDDEFFKGLNISKDPSHVKATAEMYGLDPGYNAFGARPWTRLYETYAEALEDAVCNYKYRLPKDHPDKSVRDGAIIRRYEESVRQAAPSTQPARKKRKL